jgi:hypothetical protein
MTNSITHKKAQELIRQVNLQALIYKKMAEHNLSPMELSKMMGQNRNYLYQQLSHSNQSVSVILTLSEHLQTNLFEPYVNLLSEPLRMQNITQREKELDAQAAQLQQQLADITKERDIYKSIAMK